MVGAVETLWLICSVEIISVDAGPSLSRRVGVNRWSTLCTAAACRYRLSEQIAAYCGDLERIMTESSVPRHSSSFLAVGLSVHLSLPAEKTGAQYGSSFLGWKDEGWLICEWPFHLGHPVPCSAGTLCLLRYIYEGNMIGFSSEVLSTHLQPFPLLLLAFPDSLEELPLRKHCRVPAHEPIVLSRCDGESAAGMEALRPIGGLLMDMSASSCGVLVQHPVQDFIPGMVLRVEFEIVGVGHVSNLAGVVRNVSGKTGATHLGLEFRFDGKEAIEYRGWGGSVQKALESFVLQKQSFESA